MAPRLSAKTRSDLLGRYRGRIKVAEKKRDNDGINSLWHRLIDLYRGRHFNSQLLSSSEDRIAVNICFATINVIQPAVAVNYPKLLVWARKPEEEGQAQILETVLNYWWRHYKIQSEHALAIQDWLIIGHGWLKCGWRFVEEQKAADDREEHEAAAEADPQTVDDVVPSDPNEQTANDPQSFDSEDPYEVVEDRPFVERVDPFDMLVDPEAKTLYAAKWIAQKIVKPLEEVKQDQQYREKARKQLQADSHAAPDWLLEGEESPPDDIKRVTIYEFYDLMMGTMCVFPRHGTEMLLDPIPQPYVFGHPFRMLRNYEVPNDFYPMGDLEALEPLQLELDKTRSQMMNHRKRFNRKFLFDPEALDQNGISAINKDIDNTLVPVLPTSKPLNEIIVPIAQVPVEPQLYQYEDTTLQLMDRVSGATEYQQGAMPEIRRTATEAAMIQGAADARVQAKLATVERFMADIASTVIQLAQQYMTQDMVVRTIGKNGFPLYIPCSPEDIKGEYDFEVEAGSTQPKDDQFRRNQALQLLQALTPWAQAGLVNAQELLRYALQYGFQVKNPDDFFAAATPPPQQEQQQSSSPKESVLESVNYKDLPADVQRQVEEQLGFQPSQIGGSSPAEQSLGKVAPQMAGIHQQAANQQHQANTQLQGQMASLAHQQQEAHLGRQHEAGMAQLQAGHQQQAAQQQHEQGQASAVQEAELESLLAQQAINARHQEQVINADKALGLTGG